MHLPERHELLTSKHLGVLRTIHARLLDSGIIWAVTGSLGFALQGVPIQPRDVDIQTDEAGAYQIERLFAERVVRKVVLSEAERIRSHFGALSIGGITVEIMGDVQKRQQDGTWGPPTDIRLHIRHIEVEGVRLPVLSLAYEYQAYLSLGRVERAEMLKRYAEDNHLL